MAEDRLSVLRAEMERRGLPIPQKAPTEPEHSLLERAGQFGRGMATGTAGMLDLAANYLPSGQKMAHAAVEDYGYQEPDYGPSNLSGQVGELVDKAAGQSLEPTEEDKVGQFWHGAGEFAAPFPGSGYVKAAKLAGKSVPALAKGLGSAFGKEVARGVGASAATMTPQISEEGSLMSIPENIGKAIIGSRAGEKLLSPATAKAVLTAPKKAFTELPAKVMSWGTEPNKEVFDLAEKHGVELPSNVGMGGKGGKIQNWIHNNFLKSIFVSGKYTKAMQQADQSMIDAVKKNIDTLGPAELKPSEASTEFKRHLKTAEQEAEEASKKIYTEAEKYIKPTDEIVPKNTISAIEGMRELLNRDIKSSATQKVSSKIAELADSWGINPNAKTPKIGFGKTPKDMSFSNVEAVKNNPKFINNILNSISENKTPVHLERLNGVRKELLQMIDYEPDVKGVQGYLKKVINSINKDMESAPNQQFVQLWKAANKNFKNTIGDIFRKDMAESVMKGEMPTEAFNLMTNKANIEELGRIAGQSPKGEEVFNALKKAKVRDIFAKTLGDEKLSTGNFINLFGKEGQQETLAALLPKKAYDNMVELTEIAKEYQKSGRDLLNTSGTSWVTADMNRLNDLIKGALKSFYGTAKGTAMSAGVGAGASIVGGGPLTSALVAAATPNLLSRMVSNPKIVSKARAYALARQQGNEKYADTLLSQLMKMSESDAKAALVAAQQSIPSEEKQE